MYYRINIFFAVAFSVLLNGNAFTQWENNIALINSSNGLSLCANNTNSIVTNGNTIHMVYDVGMGYHSVYYIRSDNNGISWDAPKLLSVNINYSILPTISISNNILHVSWYTNGIDYNIYYTKSTDNGDSWDSARAIENNVNKSVNPSIISEGSNVYVAWSDDRSGIYQIYFKYSSDQGESWSSDILVSNESNDCVYPSICISKTTDYNIKYKRSTNLGSNWSSTLNLNDFSIYCAHPHLITTGSIVRVVWSSSVPPNGHISEVYYDYSSNNGLSWNTDKRLTDSLKHASYPSLFWTNSVLHLVWRENRGGTASPFYKCSYDGGNNWTNEIQLFGSNNVTSHFLGAPGVGISGEAIHLIWSSYYPSNYSLFYKRNLNGNINKVELISSHIPSSFELRQNYPNPFNPATKISFGIPKSGNIKLMVYDILGREVAQIVNQELTAGRYEVSFDASRIPSGVYFYKLTSLDFAETKRMVLLK
jgi:hypothetical protein